MDNNVAHFDDLGSWFFFREVPWKRRSSSVPLMIVGGVNVISVVTAFAEAR